MMKTWEELSLDFTKAATPGPNGEIDWENVRLASVAITDRIEVDRKEKEAGAIRKAVLKKWTDSGWQQYAFDCDCSRCQYLTGRGPLPDTEQAEVDRGDYSSDLEEAGSPKEEAADTPHVVTTVAESSVSHRSGTMKNFGLVVLGLAVFAAGFVAKDVTVTRTPAYSEAGTAIFDRLNDPSGWKIQSDKDGVLEVKTDRGLAIKVLGRDAYYLGKTAEVWSYDDRKENVRIDKDLTKDDIARIRATALTLGEKLNTAVVNARLNRVLGEAEPTAVVIDGGK